MKIGLVGLPGSGKTALFTALTKEVPDVAAEYGKSHARIVAVPDARLETLRDHYQPKKFTLATIEVHDFPGIDRENVKANAAFFASIREMDALAVVLRGFEDPNYPHEPAEADPLRDWEELLTDFQVADLEMIERRIERLRVAIKKPTKTRDRDQKELDILEKCQASVEEGGRLAELSFGPEVAEIIGGFRFLTQKPTMAVVNLDDDVVEASEVVERLQPVCDQVIALRGRLEAEIAQLDPEEAEAFAAEFGVIERASEKLIRALFDLLGLRSFFTVGPDEVRAWTIKKGDDAVTAAGKIHSDIARGFIRAEVVSYDDFMAAGDMRAAKAANKVRLEGKDYVVADGDIINFRFSV